MKGEASAKNARPPIRILPLPHPSSLQPLKDTFDNFLAPGPSLTR